MVDIREKAATECLRRAYRVRLSSLPQDIAAEFSPLVKQLAVALEHVLAIDNFHELDTVHFDGKSIKTIVQEALALLDPEERERCAKCFAVVYSNYYPREIDSIWSTLEEAEACACTLGNGWVAEEMQIKATIRASEPKGDAK